MNLTVGPLPPAVYWRRRALVLGALVLLVLLLAYSCSGSSTSNASGRTPGAPSSRSPQANAGLVDSPSPAVTLLPSAPVSLPPSMPPSMPPSPTPSLAPIPATTGTGTCTDDQIKVTPVISSTGSSSRLIHGGTYDLKLKVRNISTVTCRRDVGSVPEELRVVAGHTKIWSSDDCGGGRGVAHDIRTFKPNVEIYAEVKWDSYDITTHSCKKSSTPAKVGTYELLGRVGTKSAAVRFAIVS